jgi:hypothetical protein
VVLLVDPEEIMISALSQFGSRIASTRAPSECLQHEELLRIATVDGLTNDEAQSLANWLQSRGEDLIAIVDQPHDSMVAWRH